jgi:hypothetical protein
MRNFTVSVDLETGKADVKVEEKSAWQCFKDGLKLGVKKATEREKRILRQKYLDALADAALESVYEELERADKAEELERLAGKALA